jgi:predicted neuraminidase
MNILILLLTALLPCLMGMTAFAEPGFSTVEIFPLVEQHVHGSTLVELSNGDLLAAWFQGSGERSADDVVINGARLTKGSESWSKPFLLADTDGFPDVNPVLFCDQKDRLWLTWYTVIAHQWETSILKSRISEDYMKAGAPIWKWQDVIHVKPGDPSQTGIQSDDKFLVAVQRKLKDYADFLEQEGNATEDQFARFAQWADEKLARAAGQDMMRRGWKRGEDGSRTEQQMGYPYFRRMGWQTRNKPAILADGRIILPLYSDGFDFSLMAITDDLGETWFFSEPLAAPGNIQPALLQKKDGTLIAYMRDNGPPPKKLHISRSQDQGMTWSPVRDSVLPNPGSGADAVQLENGHWVIAYNDSERGRRSLAVSLSTDEGVTWAFTRHIERDSRDEELATRSHYPAIIEGADGSLHLTYSFHHEDRREGPAKTIRYARFTEDWIRNR